MEISIKFKDSDYQKPEVIKKNFRTISMSLNPAATLNALTETLYRLARESNRKDFEDTLKETHKWYLLSISGIDEYPLPRENKAKKRAV